MVALVNIPKRGAGPSEGLNIRGGISGDLHPPPLSNRVNESARRQNIGGGYLLTPLPRSDGHGCSGASVTIVNDNDLYYCAGFNKVLALL